MTRRTFIWAAAALMGIVVTAAVAWAASQLAGQRIGLASAPLSVVSGLAPPAPPPQKAVSTGQTGATSEADGEATSSSRTTASARIDHPTVTVTSTIAASAPAAPASSPAVSAQPATPSAPSSSASAPSSSGSAPSSSASSRPSGGGSQDDSGGSGGSGGGGSGGQRDD